MKIKNYFCTSDMSSPFHTHKNPTHALERYTNPNTTGIKNVTVRINVVDKLIELDPLHPSLLLHVQYSMNML